MLVPVKTNSVCNMCDAIGDTTGHLIDRREMWVCGHCDPLPRRRTDREELRTIRVVVARPDAQPETRFVWDDFRLFSRIVGGEATHLSAVVTGNVARDLIVIHRESDDAELQPKPNRTIDGIPVRGPLIVCALAPDDHGLHEEEAAAIVAALSLERSLNHQL